MLFLVEALPLLLCDLSLVVGNDRFLRVFQMILLSFQETALLKERGRDVKGGMERSHLKQAPEPDRPTSLIFISWKVFMFCFRDSLRCFLGSLSTSCFT